MPHLSIKNVPEDVVEKLRQRAARNHRSLQGELMALICRSASEPPARAEASAPSQFLEDRKSIEQIAAEHLARWSEPLTQGPPAVDMIRADRDAR